MRFKYKALPVDLIYRPGFSHRFLSKLARAGECWEWRGEVNGGGYGRVTVYAGGRETRLPAHRVAYALAFDPPPPDRLVLHSCDNKLCCNPSHLRLGSHKDNSQDAVDRNRVKSNWRYTQDQVKYAVERMKAGCSRVGLARELGCSVAILYYWLNGTLKNPNSPARPT